MPLSLLWRRHLQHVYHRIHNIRHFSQSSIGSKQHLVYSEEVRSALDNGKPLVALESTIITHGMPFPDNLKTAQSVESIIRDLGAVPATVAILRGNVHIGLSEQELEDLASGKVPAIKTSRRDLPYVLSQGLNGGTTVSGTMLAAHWAGIPIFVTGGIGGVHRGAESTMDVSADLTELGRTPVAVISAGVKSILDVGRTLEYLETEGVCVAAYSESRDFPAFFTAKSGFQAPYSVTSAAQAARLIDSSLSYSLGSGMLIAVPIPEECATEGAVIEAAIQDALKMARDQNITGKEVTPFILDKVNRLTEGQSLQANIALVKNNAKVGAQIACELAKLRSHQRDHGGQSLRSKAQKVKVKQGQNNNGRPVVVGGINVDFTTRFSTDEIQSNGGTFKGSITTSLGGVGRNIADCLTRLGKDPLFISAVGVDAHADMLHQTAGHMDLSCVARIAEHPTATYCAVLKASGELMYGIGDFNIHNMIDKLLLEKHMDSLSSAPLVVMDGNIPAESMQFITDMCSQHHVPVWFEPTDIHNVCKLFSADSWRKVTYTSPNMNELRHLVAGVKGSQILLNNGSHPEGSEKDTLEEAVELCKVLVEHIPVVMVTIGKYGLLLSSHLDLNKPLPRKGQPIMRSGPVSAVHFPAVRQGDPQPEIVSVSGAGDCIAAAVVASIVDGISAARGIEAGLLCARMSLASHKAVPETITQTVMSDSTTRDLGCRVL